MTSSWVIQRFRRAFLYQNLLLITLRLLSDSELSEWEVLDSLYSRYRLALDAKDFRKMVDVLVNGGFASYDEADQVGKLRITGTGVRLLHGLEDEYRAITSSIEPAAQGPIAS